MPHTKVLTPYKWVTFKVCPFLILVILPCTHPLSTFHLCNVLHSPRACSNLFFVPKFSQDNHCYFSFDDKGFIVKDKTLRTMLFHNLIEHGLYPFCLALLSSIFSNKAAKVSFLGCRVSGDIWHHRLELPSSNLQQVIIFSFSPSIK